MKIFKIVKFKIKIIFCDIKIKKRTFKVIVWKNKYFDYFKKYK